jgi:hypothetical protein
MKPVQTKYTRHIIGAPKDWDEAKRGPCYGLPVVYGDGTICSYWRPSWRERFAVLFGRNIRLTVHSTTGLLMTPVWLDTEKV